MFIPKIFSLIILFATVHSRYVLPVYLVEAANILEDDAEDSYVEKSFDRGVKEHIRVARQLQGSKNPDGTVDLFGKKPIGGTDNLELSALGSVKNYHLDGPHQGRYDAASAGLSLDSANGHGLSLTGSHIPSFGHQLTGAGKLNLVHTDDHNLDANAFLTRSFPNNPTIPDFTTRGGSVDYMFRDKIGGSLGVSNTPVFQRTDYSAMGRMNLYKNPTTSLDLTGGLSKSVSPFNPHSSWEPSAGLSFRKYF